MIRYFYSNVILKYPILIICLILFSMIFFVQNAKKLEIDASSETLLLQNDTDLKFSRLMNKRYYSPNILIITYKSKNALLSKESLEIIKNISNDLKKIKNVKSITSILNVPLLTSTSSSLKDLVDDIKTLENSNINKNFVKEEFLTSPLYKNNLVSSDFKTTAIVINLNEDKKYFELLNKRNELKDKTSLNKVEVKKLKELELSFKEYRKELRIKEHNTIIEVRKIIKKYSSKAELFLGGVNMIADDIITFVKNDLYIYGSSLVLILIFVLYYIFRQIRWVLIPLFICFISVLVTTGVLGFFGWEVTVISSNFIALQLIITISIVLHLIVRYEELKTLYTKSSQKNLVLNTILSKIKPSFFAIITTIAGFSSLVLADIQPIINLGLMMSVGILLSLIISFTLFPTILVNLPINRKKFKEKPKSTFPNICANIVENDKKRIYIFSVLILIISSFGISQLIVENSFISYFKKNTEIYKGMIVIDKNLGGTTPLDIIVTFNDHIENNLSKQYEIDEDSFDEEFEEDENDEKYWFTKEKMDKIIKVHNYLSSLKEIGSVQSFATILEIGKSLNKNVDLDNFKLALLYDKIPAQYKNLIINPYISIENNQVRFSTRIIDSNPNLRRNDLIKKIYKDIKEILPKDKIRLSNLMILYNNMLQSLFSSQIKTLLFVLILLFIMFLLLFRSIKLALISIIVNLLPITLVFAFMGLAAIPLDIMTITIAAISIGIGVDDTIHYIHRYKEEYKKDKSSVNAMRRSHNSIGYAMIYTSLVIILGFSILVLSNLIPTIYFGLLTVLVMISILFSALFLLPKLLINFNIMIK